MMSLYPGTYGKKLSLYEVKYSRTPRNRIRQNHSSVSIRGVAGTTCRKTKRVSLYLIGVGNLPIFHLLV